MDRMSHRFASPGLTLIELLIALVVLAVTVTLVSPGMQQMVAGSRLRAESSRLLDALNLARSEAILRNLPVSLCPSAMALSGEATCGGEFAGGWIVFANRNRDAVVDLDTDEVIRVFEALGEGYTLTNLAGTSSIDGLITYLPDGSSRRNLSLLLCPPWGVAVEPWRVVLNNVGRARVARGDGQCPRQSA